MSYLYSILFEDFHAQSFSEESGQTEKPSIKEIFRYYLPSIRTEALTTRRYLNEWNHLFGSETTLLSLKNDGDLIIGLDQDGENHVFNLIDNQYYRSFRHYYDNVQLSPATTREEDDEEIKFSQTSIQAIANIEQGLQALKTNGEIIEYLPYLVRLIEKHENDIATTLSIIKITEDYKIYLPEFDNFEIKLPPLTKAIYLLFLHHPEGIMLDELLLHKKELLNFYLQTSSRIDLDQTKVSVENLCSIPPKEIYVHLSRIRSYFNQNFNHPISRQYEVYGYKNKPKSILALTET